MSIAGMAGQSWPSNFATDATSLYWLISTVGTVMKVGLNGGITTTLAQPPAMPVNGAQYQLLGVDSTSVYWVNQGTPFSGDSTIMKVGINGGTPTTLVAGLNLPRDGAVDSTSVYWSDEVAGLIVKVASSGGTPVTLASQLDGTWSPRHRSVVCVLERRRHRLIADVL